MNFFNALIHNTVFMSAVTGWFAAQVIKTVIYTCITKSFDPERLVGSGGMPSSHSATVCALATAAGMQYGGSSFEFAIAAIVAIIVMYDARGVRRETGLQAQVINEMMEFWEKMGQPISYEEKLKEFVGHTPLQVFVGALLGILIAVLYGCSSVKSLSACAFLQTTFVSVGRRICVITFFPVKICPPDTEFSQLFCIVITKKFDGGDSVKK